MKKIIFVFILMNFFIANAQKTEHLVLEKETLFGISKMHNVSITDLQNANKDILTNGLKVGQKLMLPINVIVAETPNTTNSSPQTHTVLAKESLFSIARQYNVSVQDLDVLNTEILKNGLQIGQNIQIPNKKKTLSGQARIINSETVFHLVLPKETKYSITKKYGISIEQLESQNPEIINGLTEGNKLAINTKQIKPSNDREELMIALAEKQAVEEKSKAKIAEVESLKDKLTVQNEMNQKVIKVNNLKVNLKDIDDSKTGSVEKLQLVLEANKNIQEVLLSKLDSLVYTMNADLDVLKNTEITDLENSKKLEASSYESINKTRDLSFQLKKDLADNRKTYAGLMNKVERITAEKNLEYKKKVRENGKQNVVDLINEKASLDAIKKLGEAQEKNEVRNKILISKIDSLDTEKKEILKTRISKATFYSKESRSYDDKLAIAQLKAHKARVIANQKNVPKTDVSEELTLDDKEKEVKQSPIIQGNNIKIEKIDNLKEVKNGYYLVLDSFQNQGERDKLIVKLMDSGDVNASFFYNVNVLSYYVYNKFFGTETEALYEYKEKYENPLFKKMFIVKVKNE
jgi:spore germination protein YaaH